MTTWLDDFITVMRHEMIIYRTQQAIANQDTLSDEQKSFAFPRFEALGVEIPKTPQNALNRENTPIHFPGALRDDQVAELLTLSTVGAAFRYIDIRTAMWVHTHPVEPIEATIKRVTGQDVVSISIDDPDLDAKLRAVYGSWGGQR